jgi:hypothetical protein
VPLESSERDSTCVSDHNVLDKCRYHLPVLFELEKTHGVTSPKILLFFTIIFLETQLNTQNMSLRMQKANWFRIGIAVASLSTIWSGDTDMPKRKEEFFGQLLELT